MKRRYFMVSPAGESYKGFPALWMPHVQTIEELFRSLGYPYRDNTAVEMREATKDEIDKYVNWY